MECDIRKFFASIDHEVLISALEKHIKDEDVVWLHEKVIGSFNSGIECKGLPLGNLTSQLLVNIYMNEFDQYIKQELRVRYYIRYADDFVILQNTKIELEGLLFKINLFLNNNLKLSLHLSKVHIKTISSGVDFLGWMHFPNHRVLRTSTKRRMFKNLKENDNFKIKQSYIGLLKHGNAYKLRKQIIGTML